MRYYLISIHPAICVNTVYIYIATFYFASAGTIYYWAFVAIDGCPVTIRSSFPVNMPYLFVATTGVTFALNIANSHDINMYSLQATTYPPIFHKHFFTLPRSKFANRAINLGSSWAVNIFIIYQASR